MEVMFMISQEDSGDNVLLKIVQHKALEERAAEFEGKIGPYEEFQWDEPIGREKCTILTY